MVPYVGKHSASPLAPERGWDLVLKANREDPPVSKHTGGKTCVNCECSLVWSQSEVGKSSPPTREGEQEVIYDSQLDKVELRHFR
jgi:hypothetical protein